MLVICPVGFRPNTQIASNAEQADHTPEIADPVRPLVAVESAMRLVGRQHPPGRPLGQGVQPPRRIEHAGETRAVRMGQDRPAVHVIAAARRAGRAAHIRGAGGEAVERAAEFRRVRCGEGGGSLELSALSP